MNAGDFTASLQVLEKGRKDSIFSPRLTRFLQPDSIVPGAGNPQNLNRYSYTVNSPLNYIDPSGHGQICLDTFGCQNVPAGQIINTGSGGGGGGGGGSCVNGCEPGDGNGTTPLSNNLPDNGGPEDEFSIGDLVRALSGCENKEECRRASIHMQSTWTEWEIQALFDLYVSGGKDGIRAAIYIFRHGTKFSQLTEQNTGAGWTFSGDITLSAGYFSDGLPDPGTYAYAAALGLIAHEAVHLEQGLLVALTLQGELEAWQAGFRVEAAISDIEPGIIRQKILELPLDGTWGTSWAFRSLIIQDQIRFNPETGRPEIKYYGWLLP